jgi:hypothetical protein
VKDSGFASRLATIPPKRNVGLLNVYPFPHCSPCLTSGLVRIVGLSNLREESRLVLFLFLFLFCLVLMVVRGSFTEVNK